MDFEWNLGWQLQLLALQHLGDVQIKEVAVQDRLNDASHNRDDIVEAWKHMWKKSMNQK